MLRDEKIKSTYVRENLIPKLAKLFLGLGPLILYVRFERYAAAKYKIGGHIPI